MRQQIDAVELAKALLGACLLMLALAGGAGVLVVVDAVVRGTR